MKLCMVLEITSIFIAGDIEDVVKNLALFA